MFIGAYYPRNNAIGFCAAEGRGAFLHARREIGEGSASCSDSLSCVVKASLDREGTATTGRGAQTLTSAITDCLLDSGPALSEPISEMVGCLASTPADGDPLSNCADEISVCNQQ